MNQILQVKQTKSPQKIVDFKKIVMFFLTIIIIFGLGVAGYLIYQNIINGNNEVPGIIDVPTSNINLTKTSENKLIINVENQSGISTISYNWNNGEIQTIEVDGKNNIEKTIDIPLGENTIHILVIDSNGNASKKQETYVIEVPRPEIELSVVGKDIKITVTSEVELSEITYQWNSDKVKKEDMSTYQDRNNFEKKLEIPLGQNTLKITAVDVNGGQIEKTQEIKGVTRATTTTKVQDGYLHFTVQGKENILKVEFEFNGQKYLMNTDTFGETKTVHYKVKLEEGSNHLKVTSETQSGGIDTFVWEEDIR